MDERLLDDIERWSIRDLILDARYLTRPSSDLLFDTWADAMNEAEDLYKKTVLAE